MLYIEDLLSIHRIGLQGNSSGRQVDPVRRTRSGIGVGPPNH